MNGRQAAALGRYRDKLDQITIRPYLAEGEQIRSAAAAKGQSVQAYIIGACRAQIERAAGRRIYISVPAETIRAAAPAGTDPRAWLAEALAKMIEDTMDGHREASGG